ncbi:MAG: hypothetical protein COZ28_01385 [Candidatus Moranbacteria bacterium CG_4_10_14_3_um_filter_44_15]|nr:MAG: hypothetical protein COS72_03170 [Candidatus Moranbacteria bacterium CG06_land_8_20_14_3_00_43_56]PIV84264.1 MAG: hypothetical protein COW51_00905 [Candidatus Moranbacteria bacterium CG17_big_fil_post_rev_8_21_14_2_50_44_12]PIW93214.1 MAG: hypothetical protein COZ87_02500 [Candidatus Moranbacteria bacterium CG_4_8_14_3_um_filter_43_15]PIX90874.1 MAG: hypothetical protein COZ28_01385 [Candidatus Moranbacteria bacterium CG_4_10_14_3_um_filter_44_15]PJA86113.1 MAG: hypothetical protein CO1
MENKEFKIALFMLPLLTQGGGAEKYFINLARNFRDRGIEMDVITMNENFFNKFARLLHIFALGNFFGKIDTIGRESEESIKRQLGKARWIKTSYKNLGKGLRNYDIIYAKNELVDLVLLKSKGYKKLPPIIVGVHTPIFYPETKSFISKLHNFLYSSFFYSWLLRGAKRVHVSNSFTENLVNKNFKIKSQLIYYPFSTEKIRQSAQNNKTEINFDSGKKNIIFAGRLSEQKGFDTLVNIIERISKSHGLTEKISLNVFGSGDAECEAKIKNLANKFPFVRYFGHVENKFIPNILVQNNLMIAPSKWETLPYSILEAQALGLPVIAFDIPGPNDIIKDSRTGFLVKTEEDFAGKIKDFAEGKIRLDKSEIVENIEKRFNPEKMYDELLNMFQENLSKAKP